jgi:serine/threonine-protein kinase ATR
MNGLVKPLSFLLTLALLAVACDAVARGDSPAQQAPLMRDFMGLNGHLAFRPDLYAPTCALVRNYHPTIWDLGDDTSQPATFPLARNKVDWSQIYGSWKKAGFGIDASLQIDSIPPAKWKNIDADAQAYGEAFAKCLGPSSSNLVQSAEIGNEPANWDNASYARVFKALATGLHAGDPKLKIVTAAASAEEKPDRYSKSVSVLDGMTDLYDVLNIHTYSFLQGWPTWRRVWPEHAGIPYLKVVQDMSAWRDAHAPGKEIWVTEFGYDAGTGKKGTGDFARWVGCTETEQAQWIVRSFLMFSSMDVQRAYLYYFNDEDEAKLHGASGITRHFKPKPAYFAMAHLYQTLGDYRFSRVVRTDKDDLYVFEYSSPDKPKEPIWVAWSPTGTQREVSRGVELPAGTGIEKAERMPLKPGDAASVSIVTDSNTPQLPISESPLYVWLKLP